MITPDRSTAAAFPKYLAGEVIADSVELHWPGLYARRWRLPRVVDLSSSHFSHVFKESTGMTPLQFVTRQRMTRARS